MQRTDNIEDLVMAYPGPAFCCLADGSQPVCNKAALNLPDADTLTSAAISAINACSGATAATWRVSFGKGENNRTLEWIAFMIPPGALLALARDVTMESRLSQVLAESRQRYRDIVELSHDFIWETNSEGRFTFVSPRGGFGYKADELSGQPSSLLLAEDVGEESPFTHAGHVDGRETWLRRKDGGLALATLLAHPLIIGDGKIVGFRGLCRPIGETSNQDMNHPDSLMRVAEYVLRPFLSDTETSSAATRAVSAATRALSATGAVIAIKDSPQAIPHPLAFSAAPSSKTLESLLRAISYGDVQKLEDNIMFAPAWNGGETIGGLAVWRSSAAFRSEEKQLFAAIIDRLGPSLATSLNAGILTQELRTDPLTGLANRRHFEETGHNMMARGMSCALIFMDLDNFKPVNDTFGHAQGDIVLKEVAHIISAAIRRNDLAARIGGDEFAILVEGGEPDAIAAIKARIRNASQNLASFSADPEIPLGISLGVAPTLEDDTLETLIARADKDMYANKRSRKGQAP
ncbi:MAG TPA: hypothetical protein DCW68_02930 [Rhodospirillaceae bacterium]|nr:MAG: hypothetical protein A2018_05905 [Alphaproteobacteria bacterium GWF2_58_20]HAU29046.1 hypothetical protein [Rhodospirillaceae bacterium]